MKQTIRQIFFLAIAFLTFVGCSGTMNYSIVGTARAAGADGSVVVDEIEGGNFMVKTTVNHLPPPERLGENLQVFMVWFLVSGQPSVKAGNLVYDRESRTGTLVATTPHPNFTVLITAESADAVSPGDIEVAKRQVGSK